MKTKKICYDVYGGFRAPPWTAVKYLGYEYRNGKLYECWEVAVAENA